MNSEISIGLQRLLLSKQIDMPVKTTVADVVMWLYEKHRIWVCIDKSEDFDWFKFNIRKLRDIGYEYGGFGSDYKSPTEAYEAAIEYTLKNLIK